MSEPIIHHHTVSGHEVTSWQCVGPASKTRYQNHDPYSFGSEYYVNVIQLADRKLRIYTKGAELGVLVRKEEILAAAIEDAMKFGKTTSGNDICSQAMGYGIPIAINFVGPIV